MERTSTKIVQRGNGTVVDVQTLGEYPTTVDRIRLSDLNQSTVVWEIATANGTPQIDRFMLKADKNPAVLEANSGSYRLVAPTNGSGFLLRKGSKYRIELWGGNTIFTKRSRPSSSTTRMKRVLAVEILRQRDGRRLAPRG